MEVQIVKINERDHYSGDKGLIGTIGTIDDKHDFRTWYSGKIFFNPPWEGADSAYFYKVKIKRVK